MTYEEKKAARLKYLNALYEVTDGHYLAYYPMFALGADLGFDRETVDALVFYLQEEGLLEITSSGGEEGPAISIKHRGVREVEKALEQPDKPTHYFPPAVNVINIRTMTNSTIQQAGHGATQTVGMTQPDTARIQAILDDIASIKDDLELSGDDRAELDAEVDTVAAQIKSPKPKRTIIKEGLASLRKIVESASGNLTASAVKVAAGSEVVSKIAEAIQSLSG